MSFTSETGVGRGRELVAIADATEAQQGVTLALGSGFRFVEEQYPHGTLVDTAVIIQRCTDRQIDRATCIQIANTGNGGAKVIVAVENAAKDAVSGRKHLYYNNFSTNVHEIDNNGAAVRSAIIIKRQSHSNVGAAVFINVAGIRDNLAKVDPVVDGQADITFTGRYFSLAGNRAIGIKIQYPDSTAVQSVVIKTGGADSEFGDAVTIEIAQRCDGRAEGVIVACICFLMVCGLSCITEQLY